MLNYVNLLLNTCEVLIVFVDCGIIKNQNKMKELIETLEQIDIDFYKGIYTIGERYDLIEGINNLLKNKKFI